LGRRGVASAAVFRAGRDPSVRAILVLIALAAVGYAMLWLGWRGTAGTILVPLQAPWVMSGGLGGLAVLGMALGAWSVHLGRRQDAEHRAAVERLVRDAVLLIEEVHRRRA
jgi:hypothetical protein